MTTKQPEHTLKHKRSQTERQKRLAAALRENLRKRKTQKQERQNQGEAIDAQDQESSR